MKILFIKIAIFFIHFFTIKNFALATFSIIAIDPKTNETGSALATCFETQYKIYSEKNNILLADYVVFENNGYGIMNVQSDINDYSPIWLATASAILAQDEDYYTAELINKFLTHPYQDKKYKERQILTLKKDKNFFTTAHIYHGLNVTPAKSGRIRHNIENKYSIAIAGNLMTNELGLELMEQAFILEKGNLADKLIAALSVLGATNKFGDKRCRAKENISSNYAFIRTFVAGKKNIDLYVISEKNVDATKILKEKYSVYKSRY